MYLGSYVRGTEVFLELNIKDRYGNFLDSDETPHAYIYRNDFEGEKEIEEIELKKKEKGSYFSYFEIKSNIKIGEYIVKYKTKVKEKQLETTDRFKISYEYEKLKDIEKDLNKLFVDLGKKEDKENVFEYLKKIYEQTKEKEIKKTTVTHNTLLTKEGYNTLFMYNGEPLNKGRIVAYEVESENIVEQTFSDSEGKWRMELEKGTYRFVFVLPNGKAVKKITEAV
jgi:tRNA-binding EMAP/Myf-like protein